MVAVHSLIVLLLCALVTASPPVARQGPATSLDLAAMMLTPADLEAVGWDGLGLQSGQMLSAADLAYRAVWPAGEGAEHDAIRDALLDAGWQQGHTTTFATIWGPDRADAGRQVEIEVTAYADAAGATEGFSLVPDNFPTGPVEPVAGGSEFGEESRLVRVGARDPQAGVRSQELALGFRRDRLTARVLLRDWTGAEPTVEAAEALAARLLTRMERELADGHPGLSQLALRVEGVEYAVRFDYYARFAGEDARSVYESTDVYAARTAGYGEAIDVFTSGTEIAASDSTFILAFTDTLYRFPNGDLASSWLREMSDRLSNDADITAFAIEREGAGIGEESLALSFSRDFGNDGLEVALTSALLVRIGADVAEIRLTRTNDPPPASMLRELAEAQAACLTANGCLPS